MGRMCINADDARCQGRVVHVRNALISEALAGPEVAKAPDSSDGPVNGVNSLAGAAGLVI